MGAGMSPPRPMNLLRGLLSAILALHKTEHIEECGGGNAIDLLVSIGAFPEVIRPLCDDEIGIFLLGQSDNGVCFGDLCLVSVFYFDHNRGETGRLYDDVDLAFLFSAPIVADLRRGAVVECPYVLVDGGFGNDAKFFRVICNIVPHQYGIPHGGVGNVDLVLSL